jgi:hypothetical protein
VAIDDERGPLWDGRIGGRDIGIALGKGWQRSKTGKGYLIRFAQGMNKKGIRLYVGGEYFVKDGLSESEKKSVAFAILQDVTYTYETLQSKLDPFFFWSGRTGFSVEDLPSNLIGLHMAFMGLGPTNERDKISDYCNVIKDHDILEQIWKCAFGDVEDLGHVKNKDWRPKNYNACRPKNYNACTDCCPLEMKWPFEEVHPASKGDLWRDWTPYSVDTDDIMI